METSTTSINASEDKLSSPPHPPGTSSGDPLTGATPTSSDRPSSHLLTTSTQLLVPNIPENNFYRYLTLKTTPPGQLKTVKLTQKVSALRGSYKSVKELPDGNMLLTCATKLQQDSALKITQIGEVKVTVSPHQRYNQSKGIVRDREFDLLSEQEIVDMFIEAGEPVSEAYKFNKPENSDRVTVCLTFQKPELPSRIKFGYKIFRVSQYIPRPRFCSNCLQYGHPTKFCKSDAKCSRCASTDCENIEGNCQKDQVCGNCQGSHSSDDKECTMFDRQKELLQIITQERLSRREAIQEWSKRHNNESFDLNRPSYLAALQNRTNSTTKQSTGTAKPQPQPPPTYNRSTRGRSSSRGGRGAFNNTSGRSLLSDNKFYLPDSGNGQHIPDSDEESVEYNSDPDLSSRTKSLTDTSISNQVEIPASKTTSQSKPPPKRHRARSESGSLSSPKDKAARKLNRSIKSDQKVIGNTVYFHGGYSPLSNFHSCTIPIHLSALGCPSDFLPKKQQHKARIEIDSAEKLYQFRKGWAFDDKEISKEILNLDYAYQVKQRSKFIKKYSQNKWHESHAVKVMCECVYRKFEHNPKLKTQLLETPDIIVESSPYDDFWGDGLGEFGQIGEGTNMLGQILTALRSFYRGESTDAFNFKDIKHRIDTDDHASFIVHV